MSLLNWPSIAGSVVKNRQSDIFREWIKTIGEDLSSGP